MGRGITPPLLSDALSLSFHALNKNLFIAQPSLKRVGSGPLKGRRLFLDDGATEMIEGTYDRKLFEYTAAYFDRCGICLDIGAHIGYHSLCFAAAAPSCRVVGFEPVPANRSRFQLNAHQNPDLAERITITPFAVGSRPGTVEMIAPDTPRSDFSTMCCLSELAGKLHTKQSAAYRDFKPLPVEAVSLDTYAMPFEGKVGIVKIDVEGAEADVVRGGMEFFSKHRPLLLIEVHSAALSVELMKLLAQLKYEAAVIDDQSRNRCIISAQIVH